jgi:hypothetical protein
MLFEGARSPFLRKRDSFRTRFGSVWLAGSGVHQPVASGDGQVCTATMGIGTAGRGDFRESLGGLAGKSTEVLKTWSRGISVKGFRGEPSRSSTGR